MSAGLDYLSAVFFLPQNFGPPIRPPLNDILSAESNDLMSLSYRLRNAVEKIQFSVAQRSEKCFISSWPTSALKCDFFFFSEM